MDKELKRIFEENAAKDTAEAEKRGAYQTPKPGFGPKPINFAPTPLESNQPQVTKEVKKETEEDRILRFIVLHTSSYF